MEFKKAEIMVSRKQARKDAKAAEANTELSGYLRDLRADFDVAHELVSDAETVPQIAWSYNRFVAPDLADTLERLSHTFPKATTIPETPEALLGAMDLTPDEFEHVHTTYWEQQALRAYDQLVPIRTEDMTDWYMKELKECAKMLDCETLPELLEQIGKDPSGAEMVAAVNEYEGKFGQVRWSYKEELNASFDAAEFTDPDMLDELTA